MQAIAAAHSNESCVAIGISHSGSSIDIVRTLELCKQNGAITIALTNYGKSPIYRASDYVLNTIADETNYTILGLSSRISQLAIIDTIYSYLVCHLDNAKESIHLTEEALQSKKY
jgi:DNA-binding MurR/RpiR family transcriptional regulator